MSRSARSPSTPKVGRRRASPVFRRLPCSRSARTERTAHAAGGYVDGESLAALNDAGLCFADILQQNDAYPALAKIGGLIMTGPTGTNVNDLAVLLLAR